MNDDGSYTIYCSRCGAPMKSNARYCMKCGNLNPDHPENDSMKKYIQKRQNYVVGSGRTVIGHLNQNGTISKSLANNTGDSKMCFIVTFSIYILAILCGILITIVSYNITDVSDIIYTHLPMNLLLLSYLFMMLFASERIYMKANHPWWATLIPIYNNLVFSKIVLGNFWLGLLGFIPIINIFYYLVIFYKLGKKFEKSGILTVLFPFVMIPVIGLGDSIYNKISYTTTLKTDSEKEYRRKSVFFGTIILVTVLSIASIFYTNLTTIDERIENMKNEYLVYVSNTVVDEIDKRVTSSDYTVMCDSEVYSGEDGIYYFEYGDVKDEFNIFLGSFVDPISIYVRMEVNQGNRTYYVSLSNGKLGFKNIESSSISVDTITNYKELDEGYSNASSCYFD